MIKQAKKFALEAHGDQKYGTHPYEKHLEDVVSHLKDFGDNAIVIGYLHDVIEDTEVSYQQVKDTFGSFIADCVAIVTDEPGTNRKERKKKTYQKMSNVSGDLELALTVKAADRLANIKACLIDSNQSLLNMYKSEQSVFKSSVYRKGLCDSIWSQINDCFDI